MKVINKKDLKAIKNICGDIWEMGGTQNVSLAHVEITNKTKPHWHEKTDELYYILKGQGLMRVGKEEKQVEKGDLVIISRGEVHMIEKISEKSLEILAITSPKYNPEDEIEVK